MISPCPPFHLMPIHMYTGVSHLPVDLLRRRNCYLHVSAPPFLTSLSPPSGCVLFPLRFHSLRPPAALPYSQQNGPNGEQVMRNHFAFWRTVAGLSSSPLPQT